MGSLTSQLEPETSLADQSGPATCKTVIWGLSGEQSLALSLPSSTTVEALKRELARRWHMDVPTSKLKLLHGTRVLRSSTILGDVMHTGGPPELVLQLIKVTSRDFSSQLIKGANGRSVKSTGEQRLKFALLGDSGVGKTRAFNHLAGQPHQEVATIGPEQIIMAVETPDTRLLVQLWDTAGIQRFRQGFGNKDFQHADGILLFFDVSEGECRESFHNLNLWLNEINRDAPLAVVLIVANKADMPNRVVSEEDGAQFATTLCLGYHEVSALTGCGVQEVFYALCDAVLDRSEGAVQTHQAE